MDGICLFSSQQIEYEISDLEQFCVRLLTKGKVCGWEEQLGCRTVAQQPQRPRLQLNIILYWFFPFSSFLTPDWDLLLLAVAVEIVKLRSRSRSRSILEVGSSSSVFLFWLHFLRRETLQQLFHLFCSHFTRSFLQIFSTLTGLIHKYFSFTKCLLWSYPPPRAEQCHFSLSNISLSQCLCSGLILYPEQNSVTFLSEIFLSQSHPYKDSALVLSSTQNRVQTFSQSLTIFLRSSVSVDVVSSVVSMRLSYLVFHCCTS